MTPSLRAGALLLSMAFVPASHGATDNVDFTREILPIISSKCFHCHGPDEKTRDGGRRLDIREAALAENDGVRAIVPGDLAASDLIVRITSTDKDEVMPPPKEHHPLTTQEIELIKRWVTQGAEYKPHWSFAPIQSPRQAGSDIDTFVAARLQKEGLALSPEADPQTLIRRLSLDLIGLPPTPDEVEEFVREHQSNGDAAVSAAADRLLASPHFGERWARMWLDLARYADSTGYGSDKFRLNVWPWRDWVIDAFNRNLPYDQFTIEQLAGDLLPNATREQIVATAFHRNTMTNVEGGTDDEEYRVAAIKDRVATTGQVWLGLTLGCAQCHSHKFDPISHRDYYSMFAIFNQTEDSDREDEEPKLPLSTPEQQAKMDALRGEIAALEGQMTTGSPELEAEQHEWEAHASKPVDWKVLRPAEAKGAAATLVTNDDGSILATALDAEGDFYTIRFRDELRGVTALRLEALPDDSLPGRGPGRASNGNAVVSEVRAMIAPMERKAVPARFVRIELPGDKKILALAEVRIFSGGENVAPRGSAKQSSTAFEGDPGRAIDDVTEGEYFKANSVTHTREEKNPWWELDLGAELPVDEIEVWNRTDSGLGERLKDFRVTLFDAARKPASERTVAKPPAPSARYAAAVDRPVKLRNASADFAQKDFAPDEALDGDSKSGWAFGGETGKPHAIVFETVEPLGIEPGAELVVTIHQAYGQNHTLGRFRIFTTSHPPPVRELPPSIEAALAIEPSERSDSQRAALAAYFRPLSKHHAGLMKSIDAKKRELAAIKPVALPILRERAANQHRKTHILEKGNFMLRGEEVQPALLSAFHRSADSPAIDRLAFAKWLLGRENPLTARVAVNRFWAQLFGTGLVETEEDFGTQGQLPSHPELLDWLAMEFRDKGWDMKAMLKGIVTSRTYRQSSRTVPEHLQKDPRNRLLARYPRRRLHAEEVRDQALMLSGLLSRKIGGPSVYPPQPDGLWRVAFNGGQNAYPTSTGEDRYRRGIYTFWRRTMPNPTMTTFDAPSREVCAVRRLPTNTPLQAFVTLNDPVFVECAQALARRILRDGGADTPSRLAFALRLCLARPVDDAQVSTLRQLFETELAQYHTDLAAARKLAESAAQPLPDNADPAELAAWTVVANVLLNLDGVLTKS